MGPAESGIKLLNLIEIELIDGCKMAVGDNVQSFTHISEHSGCPFERKSA